MQTYENLVGDHYRNAESAPRLEVDGIVHVWIADPKLWLSTDHLGVGSVSWTLIVAVDWPSGGQQCLLNFPRIFNKDTKKEKSQINKKNPNKTENLSKLTIYLAGLISEKGKKKWRISLISAGPIKG